MLQKCLEKYCFLDEKLRHLIISKLSSAFFAASVLLGVCATQSVQAQMLLRPVAGSTIYESSEHSGNYNDRKPILAFDLGSTQTVGGFGYSQFNGNGNDVADLVGTINVFSLTLAQYTSYTAGLVPSGTQPAAGGKANVAAPTNSSFCAVARSLAERTRRESFHGSWRDECLDRELMLSLAEARVIIEDYRRHYDEERPHGGLGYRTPTRACKEAQAGNAKAAHPVPTA